MEFCKSKFDDRKDHRDNKTGTQGPAGPAGPQGIPGIQGPIGSNGTQGIQGERGFNGTQGIQGERGFNGTQGPAGANGTDFDPCVACLLDALAKLDTGAILVNATITIPLPPLRPAGDLTLTIPVVIDVNVATLLQAQLGISLGIGADATIFEICAAIDAAGGSIDIDVVLSGLARTLLPIVTAQLQEIDNQLLALLLAAGITPGLIPLVLPIIINAIDEACIVAQILANVEASLNLFNACNNPTPTPQPIGEGLAPIIGGL
ncbi:MAG: hypothetical protein ACR2F1_06685 [Nitrososphaeraceae archaeon]